MRIWKTWRLELVHYIIAEAMQQAPSRIAAKLSTQAQKSDADAEAVLEETLDSTALMDASALVDFKQRFLQLKMDKHRHLAMRERIIASERQWRSD